MKNKLQKIANTIIIAADPDIDRKMAVSISKEIDKIEKIFKKINDLGGKMSKDGQKDFAKKSTTGKYNYR